MMQSNKATATDARVERDVRTVVENLEDVHTRMCRMLACDYIHTEALADLYARAYLRSASDRKPTNLSALSDIHDHYTASLLPPSEIFPSSDSHPVREMLGHLSVFEQIRLYRTLIKNEAMEISALTEHLLGSPDPVSPLALGRIVYQHNIYTDEAFLRFSRVLPAAKACYADSFVGVCEQVFDGQCEFCILPLENTQDGKLVRFYGLIEKYELKIVLTCKVTASDNRHSTVFGLCRRGIKWPQPPLLDKSSYFECVFWQEPEHLSLSKLLSAAECASLSLLRADCLPRSDDEILMGAGYPFNLCFELTPRGTATKGTSERDFLAFLMFLSAHSPTYLPLGIYQAI